MPSTLTKPSYAIICAFLLAGCATTPTAAPTPSGAPEVFIPNSSPDQVKQVIIEREVSRGWQLVDDSTYQLILTKPANNLASIVSFGSQFNGIPNVRARFTVTSSSNGTKVFLSGEMVTNPGSGFEKSYPLEDADKNAFVELQSALEKIKAGISSGVLN